jgi:hypothetical protein
MLVRDEDVAPPRRNPENPVNYIEADKEWGTSTETTTTAPATTSAPARNPESPVNYIEADKEWASNNTPSDTSYKDYSTGDRATREEKTVIARDYVETKKEVKAERKRNNDILDAMGLSDAYGDTYVKGKNIYARSVRSGSWNL